MQRGIATALALLFSWLLIVPAFAFLHQPVVPPCCRKGGAHQCTMQSPVPASAGASIRAVSATCPFSHGSLSAVSHLDFYAPGVRESVYAGIVRHPALSPQTEANFRVSYDRSRQKRGPPPSILS